MIKNEVYCDRCQQLIEREEPISLQFYSILDNNTVPADGWQYHYKCAYFALPKLIADFNKNGVKSTVGLPASEQIN